MNDTVITLSLPQLALALIPVAITLLIFMRWSLGTAHALYALGRMLLQLLLIGYVLAYIFGADDALLILLVIAIMITASSWIALNTVPEQRTRLIGQSILAIGLGGGFALALVTQAVLALEPWYMPRYMIPLAGMTFANAMTAVSLAAERAHSELGHGATWAEAKVTAYHAAMIPVINSLFAVGLVALPGMMTGQILSGVSPLIAARYQIMIMCLIFASSGIATAIFLQFSRRIFTADSAA
jgi:putative ABC transport system permease protein